MLMRCYLAYALRYRDVKELALERGLKVDHSTIKGKWVYLYRAVDKEGNTVDFMLSEQRTNLQPEHFLRKLLAQAGFLRRSPWIKVAPIRPALMPLTCSWHCFL